MKSSLFEKRNPTAVASKKKNIPNCITCPNNKQKKRCFLDARVSSKAEVLFILPHNKTSPLRRMIREWQKQTPIDKISFLPDTLCKHEYSDKDKKYAVLNLHCSNLVKKQISRSNITHVFLVGIGAVRSYFGEAYGNGVAYHKVRGFTMPDLKNNLMVSFVLEPTMDSLTGGNRDDDILQRTIFKQDLQKGMRRFGEEIQEDWKNPQELCHVVEEDQAIDYMEGILEGNYESFIAFDYEATGLKPFRKGQEIVSCSIATSSKFSFAFMMTEKTNEKLRKILRSTLIPKVAANNPYEYKMTKFLLGHGINNLLYDCCLGAHLLDLRGGIVSVKFQARMRYGITDYEKSMKKYLVPSDKETEKNGANAINTIRSAPQRSVLMYNAMDSLLEYWIAVDSMEELGLE